MVRVWVVKLNLKLSVLAFNLKLRLHVALSLRLKSLARGYVGIVGE
jgi:hypothetical protein